MAVFLAASILNGIQRAIFAAEKGPARIVSSNGPLKVFSGGALKFKGVSAAKAKGFCLTETDSLLSGVQTTAEIALHSGRLVGIFPDTQIRIDVGGITLERGRVIVRGDKTRSAECAVAFPGGSIASSGSEIAVAIDGEKGVVKIQAFTGKISVTADASKKKIKARAGEILTFETARGIFSLAPAGNGENILGNAGIEFPYHGHDLVGNASPADDGSSNVALLAPVLDADSIEKYGSAARDEKFEFYLQRLINKGHNVSSLGGIVSAYSIYKKCGGTVDEFMPFDEYRKTFGKDDTEAYNKSLNDYLNKQYGRLIDK